MARAPRRQPAVKIRFDVANPRANRLIETQSSKRIVAITADTRASVRQVLTAGYEKGRHPYSIALDLIGRRDNTGQRVGGVLGLTPNQTDRGLRFRELLESGEPSEMSKALDFKLRDKRFDATIEKAIANEEPIDPDKIDAMVDRYFDRSLQLRGETVARTETGKAVHEAAHEAFAQGLEKTGYPPQAVTRTWRSAGDEKVRDSHAEMDGQEVQGLNQPYTSPSGARLMHPLDDSLGAPAEEIINCRCDEEINIDFSYGLENEDLRNRRDEE